MEDGLAGESNKASLAEAAGKAIDERKCVVGIVGLGYVGLPLALTFARIFKRPTDDIFSLDKKK